MARITLYNSRANTGGTPANALMTPDPGGPALDPVTAVDKWPATLPAAITEAESGRSSAVRLIGFAQDVRFISLEFFMEFSSPADVVYLKWFQEFLSDKAYPFFNPATTGQAGGRPGIASFNATGFNANFANWMRETSLVDAGSGQLDMFPITRNMKMSPSPFIPNVPPANQNEPYQQSLHVPLSVHANWMRVGFWIDDAASAIADINSIDLYINAHVGGHLEFEYLESYAGRAYDYNAYKNLELPEGAKLIKKGTG